MNDTALTLNYYVKCIYTQHSPSSLNITGEWHRCTHNNIFLC